MGKNITGQRKELHYAVRIEEPPILESLPPPLSAKPRRKLPFLVSKDINSGFLSA